MRVCLCAWVLCACESACAWILIGGLHCSHAEGCRLFLIHRADLDSKIRHIKWEMLSHVSTHTHTHACTLKHDRQNKNHITVCLTLICLLFYSSLFTSIRSNYWFDPFTPNHTSVIPLFFSHFTAFPLSLSSRNLTSNRNVKNANSFSRLAQFTQTYNWILPINIKAFFILIVRPRISLSTIHANRPYSTIGQTEEERWGGRWGQRGQASHKHGKLL